MRTKEEPGRAQSTEEHRVCLRGEDGTTWVLMASSFGRPRPIGTVVTTDVPPRLDRLAWSPWHSKFVIALGVTWILDGLEASLIANMGPALTSPRTLGLTAGEIGLAGSAYLAGALSGALLFGHWTDKYGRKRLFLVTLTVYLLGTALSGLAPNLWIFLVCRFVAGAGIGGEYSAINSAIDELIPARSRGQVDLGVNGSYWLGVAAGSLLTLILLDPTRVPQALGWRLAFGLGASLGLLILAVRRRIPESPRWLLMHGYVEAATETVAAIERAAGGERPPARPAPDGQCEPPSAPPQPPVPPVQVEVTGTVGFTYIARILLRHHLRRTVLGLSLMAAQAFFYNAVFFTYALILNRFYRVPSDRIGLGLIPVAVASFLGPAILGRLYDTVGRRRMIAASYSLAGLLLALTGLLFLQGALSTVTQVLCWCVVLFFGSAAASSAYLTVSELFPVELRGRAIALFFAAATGFGALGPISFGLIVQSGSRLALFAGYLLGGGLMVAAGAIAAVLGVDAEQKPLEELRT